jgi:hypothetical protein
VHFPRELGHISQGKTYFEVAEIYCCEGGRTVQIRTVHTTGRRAQFSRHFVGTKIEVVLSIPCYRRGRTDQVVQQIEGTVLEVLFSGWVVQ